MSGARSEVDGDEGTVVESSYEGGGAFVSAGEEGETVIRVVGKDNVVVKGQGGIAERRGREEAVHGGQRRWRAAACCVASLLVPRAQLLHNSALA
jgi:hypothetical protein